MSLFLKRYALWFVYLAFMTLAMAYGGREDLFAFEAGGIGAAKAVVLAGFIGFLIYSIHATRHENFFRTLGTMNRLYWGRQIGLDLYISVFLSLGVIYLVEGSLVVLLLWAVPILFFANLAILPYLLLNFGAVIGVFLA